MTPNLNQQQILLAIQADPSLSPEERAHVMQVVNQVDFVTKLAAGSFGASLAYLLSKFMGLGRTAQVLLSIAGFGIGRLILDASTKPKQNSGRFATYNEKMKTYEVNQGRD
jgi:hypothetical protein